MFPEGNSFLGTLLWRLRDSHIANALFHSLGRRRETNMQTIHPSEHYTDKGDFAVTTRTTVVKYARLASIAGHLRRNAEDLVSSTDPVNVDNCRIAGTMVGWACSLVPLRLGTGFDY
jgi:hypothetical protein